MAEPLKRRISPIGVMIPKNTRLMITLVMIQFKIKANFIQPMYRGRNTAGAKRPPRKNMAPMAAEMDDVSVHIPRFQKTTAGMMTTPMTANKVPNERTRESVDSIKGKFLLPFVVML